MSDYPPGPPGYHDDPYWRPPPPSGGGKTALLVLAIVGGVALLCIGAGVLFVATAEEEPVTARDTALLVRAEDVATQFEGWTPRKGGATTVKTKYFDRSYDLEYTYQDDRVYIRHMITIERKKSDALTAYQAERVGNSAGFQLEGGPDFKVQPRDELFEWGDDSTCSVLSYQGQLTGLVIVARKGKKVFNLVIAGASWDDAHTLKTFLEPKLDALESYEP